MHVYAAILLPVTLHSTSPSLPSPLPSPTIQSIIYKLSRSRHLEDWLHKVELIADLEPMADDRYVDNWTNFNDSHPFLLDYSQARDGITRNLFVAEFYPLIQVCTRHSMGEAVRGTHYHGG